MGFANFRQMLDACSAGNYSVFSWRKTPTQTTAAGIWFDLSMSPGNPNPNYYASAPLISQRLSLSDDGGIYHGGAVSPKTKHLARISAFTTTAAAVPLQLMLCDYLLYYPFVDMSVAGGEAQPLTNSLTLPRSTDGAGVRIMAVEVASQIGGCQFYCTYTNQSGVVGRVTSTVTCNSQVSTGTIVSTAPATSGSAGPFLPLQQPDTGVRSIESATFLGAGDVGLISLVLVKPVTSFILTSTTAASEVCHAQDRTTMPKIEDNAYLNLICCPNGTLASAPIHGLIETVFN